METMKNIPYNPIEHDKNKPYGKIKYIVWIHIKYPDKSRKTI